MSNRLVRIVDHVVSTHFINPQHVVRITLHRASESAAWTATVVLTNGDGIKVIDDDVDRLVTRLAVLTGDVIRSGVQLDRPKLEDDRYLVLLVCGHWVHTRIPEAEGWLCPVIGGSHGTQPATTTEDGQPAILATWDLYEGVTSA